MSRATSQWEEPDVPESPDQNHVVVYEQRAAALVPTDDQSLKSCAEFIEQCKLAEKRVEEKRKAQVGPLNKQVEEINAAMMPVAKAFRSLWQRVDQRVGKFIDDRRRQQEDEQRKANDAAAAKQVELDRQAEVARQAAADAATRGDVKGAIKAESKAISLEQKAADTVAPVVDLQSKTLDLGTSTLSVKAPKKDWNLPGWDRKRPLPAMDPLLAPLVGDLEKLPEGIRFLLQYSDLNPVRLNAGYKAGTKFPKPFDEVQSFGGSTLRSA